jgi:putative endonuclease
MENKRDNKIKGEFGENRAVEFLEKNGWTILVRNFKCSSGEIDIIALEAGVIHFVEVKSQTADNIRGRFAVNKPKQNHIRNTARHYLVQNGLTDKCFCSFDVIEITGDEIEFLQNCFY